jgi:hypothetical protein
MFTQQKRQLVGYFLLLQNNCFFFVGHGLLEVALLSKDDIKY